jgi:tetratricopeptide (TPR) repeat protein
LALFGKKNASDGSDDFKRDPRKARRFFEHAETTADAHNYDYSIACYISGLRHDPDNMSRHEALYEVAKRRKVSGGKPAGFGEKHKGTGSTAVDKMLHAEKIWAMNILNAKLMHQVMKFSTDAAREETDLHIGEVVYWIGGLLVDNIVQSGKIDKHKSILGDARDCFAAIGAFDKAVEACRYLVRLNPDDASLLNELKDLEAERTMQEGGYSSGEKTEEGGFRDFVRDAAEQDALEQDASLSKTESVIEQTIARRRVDYEEDPQDNDKLLRLVEALIARESNESENEAMQLLQQAWDQAGQYRYKVRLGDIQMKQFNRQARQLRQQYQDTPGDEQIKHDFETLRKEQLVFELKEYEERVQNYPTDMKIRFEYGKRLHKSGNIDEAISAFQQAKQDPKHRPLSHQYLGTCYLAKGWLDEAIDTLKHGKDAHKLVDDRLALDLRYLLMDAQEKAAAKNSDLDMAREAQKLASEILQANIKYRDITQRADRLRELVVTLQKQSA